VALIVTYYNELGIPPSTGSFQILADGTPIARFTPNTAATGFYMDRYAIPANVTAGKSKVTVRFQADGSSRITPIYGIRTIRVT
jgi:hypothetical protein